MTDSDSPKSTRSSARSLSPAMIALVAVLIAFTFIMTKVVQIPIPASQGYWNLSDAATAFAGFIFGPWVGFVAGGLGTALADLSTGLYATWAPISLLAHGLEGLLIGFLGRNRRSIPGMILAYGVGALAMILVYLVGGAILKGWPAALAEVPFNAIQAVVGGIVGIPLVLAVRKAYPPIDRIGQRSQWTEE